MSTIKVQNIYETTNFFTDYFLSRTGVIVLFDCLIALTRVNSMSPDFVVKRPFFIAKEGK